MFPWFLSMWFCIGVHYTFKVCKKIFYKQFTPFCLRSYILTLLGWATPVSNWASTFSQPSSYWATFFTFWVVATMASHKELLRTSTATTRLANVTCVEGLVHAELHMWTEWLTKENSSKPFRPLFSSLVKDLTFFLCLSLPFVVDFSNNSTLNVCLLCSPPPSTSSFDRHFSPSPCLTSSSQLFTENTVPCTKDSVDETLLEEAYWL